MSMPLESEMPEKGTGEISVPRNKDEVKSLSDTEKSKSQAPSESCLLCGSCDSGSYEMESANRVKWTLHFCQLFRIDECPLVAQTTKAEMWTAMQGALYCSDCMDSLERISHLLQTIEDINAQLRVIQLQCEAKLRTAKQNLHDPHEVKRRRSLWTCMRVGEATGTDRDLRVTGIELPSTSASVVNDKDDWVGNETEPGSNSPASPFSLRETDFDSDFDPNKLKQEPLDSPGPSLSPMSTVPIQVMEEQSASVKLEPGETGREKSLAPGGALKRLADAEDERRSKKSRHKRMSYKRLKARYNLREVSVHVERLESDESESDTESNEFSDSNSSSSSLPSAPPTPKPVRRRRIQKPRRIRSIESGSGSASECSDKEEQKSKAKMKATTKTKAKAKSKTLPGRKGRGRPKSGLGKKKSTKRGEGRQSCPFAPECTRTFHTKANRDEHVVLVHEGKKFTCELCCKSYGLQKLLEEHGNVHKGLTPYKCQDCPQEFAMSHHLRMHKLKLHSEKPFKCESCDKAFITEVHYNKHLESDKHRQRSERGKVPAKDGAEPGKPRAYPERTKIATHKCPFPNCNKVYALKYSLKTHLLTHDDAVRVSLTCSFCQRSFETKHSLKQHEALQHTGEASFRCEQCPFLAMNKVTLQKHVDTVHSEERPVQCDICGHTFKHTSYLRQHKQRCHPQTKDHMCSICGKCFSNKRYLQEHDETHKEIKSFLCTHCGRGFTQRTSLNKHMRSVHKIFGSGHANNPNPVPPVSTSIACGDTSPGGEARNEQTTQHQQPYIAPHDFSQELLSLIPRSFVPY